MTQTQVLPDRMRASVLHGVEHVEVEHRAVPAPADDEVLVHIQAVGLCGSDVHYYRHGRIGSFVVEQPMILGHESAGVIAAVGSAVDPGRIGQRVSIEPQRSCRVCAFCKRGEYNLCRQIEFYATPPIDGSFAEYAVIQADFAHPIPDRMSIEAAALLEPLSVGIATARKAGFGPGTSVLIAGCGPIGLICAQVAKAYGVGEIAMTDLVAARRERALSFGATRVIDPAAESLPGCALRRVRRRHRSAARGPQRDHGDRTGRDRRAGRDGRRRHEPAGRGDHLTRDQRDRDLPLPQHLADGDRAGRAGLVDLDALVTARYGLDDVITAIESDTSPDSLKSIIVPDAG